MMCDGSGELRHGLCRGCDNCNGLTTPPRPITQQKPAPVGTDCPWCGTWHLFTDNCATTNERTAS